MRVDLLAIKGDMTEPADAMAFVILQRQWQQLVEDAGIDYQTADGHGRGLHELRRTFATRLRDVGVPLEDVQKLGRWASPQVLLDHYAAVSDDRLRDAADRLGEALDGS